jgi:hypothetical protein
LEALIGRSSRGHVGNRGAADRPEFHQRGLDYREIVSDWLQSGGIERDTVRTFRGGEDK